MLADDAEFQLLGLAATEAELIACAGKFEPDVILYSLNFDSALTMIDELRRVAPRSAIVLWGHEFSAELANHAMELRVQGMLSTTSSIRTMKECLKVSAGGQMWMEHSLSSALLNAQSVSLSKRQSQIVSLLVQGHKNKEIATELGISEGTVKGYLTTLFEKVGAKDRFELALFGLKNLRNIADSARGEQPMRAPLRSMITARSTKRSMV
jgi:DNA-binding NarL/FixJ family response regulator